MTIATATLHQADSVLAHQPYITEKELPALHDRVVLDELTDALVDEHAHNGDTGYLYGEDFDFANGEIAGIIWNMDVIKTRQAAKETLAKDMGYTMPKEVPMAEVEAEQTAY